MDKIFGITKHHQRLTVGYHALNPYRLSKYVATGLCILLVVTVLLKWIYPSESLAARSTTIEAADRTVPVGVQALALGLMLAYIVLTGVNPGQYGFNVGTALGLLAGAMLLSTLLSAGSWGKLYIFIKSAYWMIGVVALYRLSLGGALTVAHIRATVIAVVILDSYYTIAFCLSSESRMVHNPNTDACLLIWCIPLLLLCCPPPWAFGLVALASVAVIVTLKRGAILALLIGGFAYAVVSMLISSRDRNRLRHLIVIILLMAVIVGGLVWQWENLQYRMKDFDDPDSMGSGRGWVYRTILSEWYGSGLFALFFGRGFFTVPDTLGRYETEIYAHNDWLEVLHDLGLVGVVLFAYVHAMIISVMRQGWRLRHSITAPLVMGYTSFAITNLCSQCVVDAASTIFFGLLLGYAAAAITNQANKMGIYK